eukprot:362170-Chlamydomonas_euryale.AAC.2
MHRDGCMRRKCPMRHTCRMGRNGCMRRKFLMCRKCLMRCKCLMRRDGCVRLIGFTRFGPPGRRLLPHEGNHVCRQKVNQVAWAASTACATLFPPGRRMLPHEGNDLFRQEVKQLQPGAGVHSLWDGYLCRVRLDLRTQRMQRRVRRVRPQRVKRCGTSVRGCDEKRPRRCPHIATCRLRSKYRHVVSDRCQLLSSGRR